MGGLGDRPGVGDEIKGAVTYWSLPVYSISGWQTACQLEIFVVFMGTVALCRPLDLLFKVEAAGSDDLPAKLEPGGVLIPRACLS